jgi:hypothetical protein
VLLNDNRTFLPSGFGKFLGERMKAKAVLRIRRPIVEPQALDLGPVIRSPVDPSHQDPAAAGEKRISKPTPRLHLNVWRAVGQDPDESPADRLSGGYVFAPKIKPIVP